MGIFSFGSSLPTTPLLTLPGTASCVVQCNGYIYLTYKSTPQGSPFTPLTINSYSEIARLPVADFFDGRGTPEPIIRINGAITTATLSNDQSHLYFILRKLESSGTKNYFCKFDMLTHNIISMNSYDTIGSRLQDINGNYIVDFHNLYISVTYDEGQTWHDVVPDKPGKRSAFYNGDAYYMVSDDHIMKVPKSSIDDKTFQAVPVRILDPSMKAGHLFADDAFQVYVTLFKDNIPYLFNVITGAALPLSKEQIKNDYRTVNVFFKNGESFYGMLWAADRPLSKDTRVIKVTGNTIEQTDTFGSRPNYLGVVGDYLVFNHDRVFKRKSYVFGIKYK